MFSQFPKKTLFSKIISGIVMVSFILTSVPVRSYAALGAADKLRRPGADSKHAGNVEIIREELEVLGELVNLNKTAGFNLQINSQTGKLTFSKGFKNEAKWIKPYSDKDIAVSFVPEDLINSLSDKLKNYFGFRDFLAKADEATINKLGLRYDITVLPPGRTFGNQFSATKGHEHPVSSEGDTYPEIYEVIYGEALYLQQGVNKDGKFEVIATFAKAGDKVILLTGYSHRTVNIGKTFLVMANWISTDVGGKESILNSTKIKPVFSKIEEKHGYAYLVEEDANGKIVLRPNLEYGNTPVSLKINTPVGSVPEIGIDNKVPMYGIIHTDKAKALSLFLKLAQGKGFENVLSSAYKEINLAEAQNTHNLVGLQDTTKVVMTPISPIITREPVKPIITLVNKPEILVLDNEITGFSGANTGVHNVNHAMLNKADGGLYNHSEPRARLEDSISKLLISVLRDAKAISWTQKDEEIKAIKERIANSFVTSLKIMTNLDVSKLPEKEKNAVLSSLDKIYSIVHKLEGYQDTQIELLARTLVNKVVNMQLKNLIAQSKKNNYPIQQTVLCVGETKAQYLLDRTFQEAKGEKVFDKYLSENTKKIISQDLTEILEGISKEDAQRIGLRAAYEPRWAINTGLTPSSKEIQDAHRFIKDTVLAIPNLELVSEVDYGGSLNPKNAKEILGLPDVDGGLIGGAAKTPEAISSVLGEAIAQGQKKGKILNVGMNWKAEDQETGLKPLSEFEETFKNTDLSKVRIVISTPQVPVVKARMAKLAVVSSPAQIPVKLALLNKFSAYLSAVSGTEEIGPGYSKGIIASSEKTEQLEKLFGEKTKKGDTYFIIGKNNAYFALAKENNIDQALTVLPTVDLSNPAGLEAYSSSLLEYVSLVTTKSQKGLELINIAGDELKLKSFLTNKSALAKARPNSFNVVEDNFVSGSLAGIKRWMGTGLLRDEFFQFEYKSDLAQKGVRPTLLTFKRSKNKLTRGWSAIVQPKYTHLIFGFGTIGSEVGKKSREMGFNIVAVNRSPNEKAGLAQSLGVPLYLLNSDDKKAFEKAKIGAEGILEDLLKNGEVDLITDATDGETEDLETKEEITVAAYNKKYIYSKYPKIKVMYEGAEDPKIADRFFDSGTLNVLKIPYSKAMEGVNSLFFPSCNTTGQGFILDRLAFNSKDLVVRVTTGRRANDPGQKGKLSPDGTAVETGYHHAEDYLEGRQGYSEIINAFRKGAKNKPSLTTDASNTHLTKFHLTEMWISGFDKNTGKRLTAESVKKFLSEEPRIALVDFKKDKFDATLLIDILFNKLSVIHPFTPIVQVLDLPDSGDVKITKVVPQESIVIPNNMNGIHALTGLYEREASTRLVNDVMQLVEISQAIESTLPLKSARVKTKESKEVEIPAIPGIVTYTNKQLEDFKSPDGKPVYATLNTDVGDIENAQVSDKQDKKLIEGYDYLERLSNNNALYILGHNGRPAGKYVEKLSLFAVAKWYAFQREEIYGQGIEDYIGKTDASGRFIEASYWIIKNYRGKGDVKVWFLPDTDNASINKYAQIVKDLKPGDWAIPENRRMDLREQAGDPAGENPNADPKLREAAIKDMLYRGGEELLVGPVGFNFGTADVHRYDARITDAGKFLLLASGQNTADFIGRVNKIRTLISQAHEKGAVAFVVSGLKKDKIELLLEAINNVLREGDKVVVVGAINAYPLAAEGKTTGKMEIKKDALETWKEVVEAAKAKGIDLYYPKALKVVKDLTTAKKEDIQVIQDGNIPEGYVIGDVADQGLTEIFNIFEDENVKLILQSGPVGPFDLNDVLAEGSNKFQQKLAELSLKKKVVSLGSDTQKANKKAGVEGKFPDQYTDGGSFLDALTSPADKDVPAIAALKESAKIYPGVLAKDIEKEAERVETAAGEVATKN
ncbi:MAG: phosphoglycerate kinase [Candidatus Omnitrophota bacterium]|nr:phosphoglycerate kinase [Candidatus Omnitrophota bacterium]